MLEVVLRWGDDTVDVQYVNNYAVAGIPLVRNGQILGESRGQIGLVTYAIEPASLPARSLPYTRGDDLRVLPYLLAALVAHLVLWRVATEKHPIVEDTSVVSVGDAPRPLRRTRISPSRVYVANPNGVDTPKRQAVASRGKRGAAAHVGASTGTARKHSSATVSEASRVAGMLDQISSDRIQIITGKLDLAGAMAKADLGGDAAMTSSFGTSFNGDGGGGGGTGWGTIGTGRYASLTGGIGDGAQYTNRQYPGEYPYYPHRRIIHAPSVTITKLEVEGELDPAKVRRYIKRNITKVAYCFEKEALRTPLDSAPAEVAFTIMRDGHVDDAITKSRYAEVTTCVSGVINAIEFPQSSGSFSFVSVRFVFTYRR